MQLISLKSNNEKFKTVNFNPSGLSLIVAEVAEKNSNQKNDGKTYNGVGKSLIVYLIHFCLGADKRDYKSFSEKLEGWEFILEFRLKDLNYIVSRKTSNIDKIQLNDEVLSISEFNNKLENICFEIPENVNFLSFRSLIPFFIRPYKESYISVKNPIKKSKEYQQQLSNSFLLGLDVSLAQKKYEIKKEKDDLKELEKQIKSNGLLKEFISGNKDVDLTILDLEEKINILESDLSKFEIAEDYYAIKKEADEAGRDLFEIKNQITLLYNQLNNINDSIKISPDLLTKNSIKKTYEEAKFIFPDKINKTLNQLEQYYQELIDNRIIRLTEQKNHVLFSIEQKEKKSQQLQNLFDEKMKYLGSHKALDVFISINSQVGDLKNKKDSLQKYKSLQEGIKTKKLEIKEKFIKFTEETNQYLKDSKDLIEVIKKYFRDIAIQFYPNSPSGISVDENDGDNQLTFKIEPKIESDQSDGINSVKIFCYDMTILFKGSGHSINFIFHDSRLFSEIDHRQKTSLFKIAHKLFSGQNYQYITTINQNQLEEIKSGLSDQEYKNIIEDNIVLTLDDNSVEGKLLGTQVDFDLGS
jgi:uncharacterized protein YydD (DUF2326 family)